MAIGDRSKGGSQFAGNSGLLEDDTATFTRVTEDMVRTYPEQGLWIQQRWKRELYHS